MEVGEVGPRPPRGPEPAADGWAADPQAKHAAVEARWRPLWEAPGAAPAAAEPWLRELDALPAFEDPGELPVALLGAIRRGGSPGAAGGLDGWAPGEWRLLPPEVDAAAAAVLRAVEGGAP